MHTLPIWNWVYLQVGHTQILKRNKRKSKVLQLSMTSWLIHNAMTNTMTNKVKKMLHNMTSLSEGKWGKAVSMHKAVTISKERQKEEDKPSAVPTSLRALNSNHLDLCK